ncbi:MAG: universal stress protein [Chloroflexi bacterium]|nr:universal stress protein [Chloroflexota bacterium]
MAERILVGLDGSPLAESILPAVRALAEALQAEVTVLSVVDRPDALSDDQHRAAWELMQEQAKTTAKSYVHRIESEVFAAGGIAAKCAVVLGDPATEITAYAENQGIDLIALATHGRSGFDRWLHGSVAEEVMLTTRTPLLLLHPADGDAPASGGAVTRIVAPLDGSPLAEGALPLVAKMALALKAPVNLVQAVEPVYLMGEPMTLSAGGYGDLLDGLQEAAKIYLNQTAQGLLAQGIAVTLETPLGSPAREVIQRAQSEPGALVIMATHGRSGLAGAVLGSVARRVVRSSGTPTLLVRPAATES